MKKVLMFICLASIIACKEDRTPKVKYNEDALENNVNEHDSITKDSTVLVIADLPVHIDSTEYVIHPIGNYKIEDYRGKTIFKSSSGSSGGFSISSFNGSRLSGNISNLKFQHLKSNDLYALTNKNIVINSVQFLKDIYQSNKKQYLVYEIIDEDTNDDGELNYLDIETLYISDISGKRFEKLTEKNMEIIDWKIVSVLNKLYFRCVEDINKDGVFNKKDKIHYSYVDLSEDSINVIEYYPI